MTLHLNPIYRLRPDGGRTLLQRFKPYDLGEPMLQFLHPLVGVVLSLIDGTRDEADLVRDTAFILDVTEDAARAFIEHIFHSTAAGATEPLLVTSEEADQFAAPAQRKCRPEDFIVHHTAVDLRSRKLQFPISINFIVTNRCSSRCVYCYAERELSPITTHLPLKRVLELIDEVGQNRIPEITFSGGDPFEWPHIILAVKRTLQAGITPCLSTKAFLSQKRCADLAAIGVTFMQYSLDAATAETAYLMTGRRNFLTEAVASIRNLINTGIHVRLKAVITPYNVSEVPALVALASGLGVRIAHLVPYGRSTFRHSDSLFLDDATSAALGEQLRLLQQNYRGTKLIGFGMVDGIPPAGQSPARAIPEANGDTPSRDTPSGDAWAQWKAAKSICSMGRTNLTILPDGSVLMCEQLPSEPRFIVGSVAHRSIRELWNSPEFVERTLRPDRKLFRGSVCYECSDFAWCHEIRGRCIRDAFKAYGDPYQADPRCPKAPPAPRL